MARVLTCDICKRPTPRIVGKLLFIPVNGEGYAASDYEALADVGECCQQTLSGMVKFRQRKRRAKTKEAEPVA